jgi:hypothetical protein
MLKVSNAHTNVTKLWQTIKSIDKGKLSNNNQAIKFGKTRIVDNKEAANAFNKQYTTIVPHASTKESRVIRRLLSWLSKSDAPYFRPDQVHQAIKSAKSSKAIGPDGISAIHLQ